jgi:hypothetical protein
MGHRLDDKLLDTDVLNARLGDEANFNMGGDDRRHWKVWVRDNGTPVMRSVGLTPSPGYQEMAITLIQALNHHLHHDGAWLAVWTDWHEPTVEEVLSGRSGYPERLVLLWIDHGGDPQFPVEIEDDFVDIVKAGADHWIEQAEEAWVCWHHHMREVLDPKPEQLYFAAQGERKPSLH